ncbi:hypothetical protein LCGC14_1124510 [marine sediment metagenome]|uniref:Uncharacterized protein n=1 Tax=marine sediment metagenome TaxID=412755 RepID=A0A0F9M7Q5_9ZZZZ
MFLYHANKPIFSYNYIEDTFEDQIPMVFPAGWISLVNPWNVRVVYDNGNKVMEVESSTTDVTEVTRRFKKTTIGIVECKVKMLDVNGRFVIHLTQLDREYDPYDDIIIAFLDGGVHVVGEDNIIASVDGDSWAMDEQGLEDSVPLMNYVINVWYLIKIEFNRENLHLSIDGNLLGVFGYPKYNPPYFTAVYFVSFMTSSTFRFYIDDVKITLSNPVDYIHPANVILLLVIPISIIIFIYFFKKRRGK